MLAGRRRVSFLTELDEHLNVQAIFCSLTCFKKKKKKLSLWEFQSWQISDPRQRLLSVPSIITSLTSSREKRKKEERLKKEAGGG